MKKLLFTLFLFFFFSVSANAQITTFIDPDISMLPASASISGAGPNDPIAANTASREQFCFELGGTYISYNSTANFQTNRARFFGGTWELQGGSRSIASEIVCDIPVTNPGNSGGGTFIGGGTSSSFSGSIETREYLQLFVYKDGESFINYETFTFLVLIIFLFFLLSKTLINILVYFFVLGWYFSTGNKILGKK